MPVSFNPSSLMDEITHLQSAADLLRAMVVGVDLPACIAGQIAAVGDGVDAAVMALIRLDAAA